MQTLDLLDKALESGQSARDLARELGFSENAMNTARNRGHLSGEMAGALADHLGLEPGPWMALAVVEGAKKPLRTRVAQKVRGAVGKSLNAARGVAASFALVAVAFAGLAGSPTTTRATQLTDHNVYSRRPRKALA